MEKIRTSKQERQDMLARAAKKGLNPEEVQRGRKAHLEKVRGWAEKYKKEGILPGEHAINLDCTVALGNTRDEEMTSAYAKAFD